MRAVLLFLLEWLSGVLNAAAGMAIALVVMNHLGYRVRIDRVERKDTRRGA